jgi:hypothetical protein
MIGGVGATLPGADEWGDGQRCAEARRAGQRFVSLGICELVWKLRGDVIVGTGLFWGGLLSSPHKSIGF